MWYLLSAFSSMFVHASKCAGVCCDLTMYDAMLPMCTHHMASCVQTPNCGDAHCGIGAGCTDAASSLCNCSHPNDVLNCSGLLCKCHPVRMSCCVCVSQSMAV